MNKGVKAIIAVAAFLFTMWFFFGGGLEKSAENKLDTIKIQVAKDSEEQYNIAKRSGSKMDAYVHAQMTAAAYLQAKDEASYQKWKAIEKEEAAQVGITLP